MGIGIRSIIISVGGKIKKMRVQLVTSQSCAHCMQAKEALDRIKKDTPNLEIEVVDLLKPEGMELAQKYGIMASPGIIINGKLAFQGGATEEQLRQSLRA